MGINTKGEELRLQTSDWGWSVCFLRVIQVFCLIPSTEKENQEKWMENSFLIQGSTCWSVSFITVLILLAGPDIKT